MMPTFAHWLVFCSVATFAVMVPSPPTVWYAKRNASTAVSYYAAVGGGRGLVGRDEDEGVGRVVRERLAEHDSDLRPLARVLLGRHARRDRAVTADGLIREAKCVDGVIYFGAGSRDGERAAAIG